MQSGVTVRGTVLDEDAGPLVDSEVGMVLGKPADVLGRDLVGQQPQHHQVVDQEGCFSFGHVAPGIWTVFAQRKDCALAWMTLEVGHVDPSPVILRLKESCSLSGRLVGGESLDLSGWVAVATPFPESRGDSRAPFMAQARVSTPGSFRIGPLAPGDWETSLLLPVSPVRERSFYFRGRRAEGTWIKLGRVLLEPGVDHQAEFDVKGRLPGGVCVDARVMGTAMDGLVLEAYAVDPDVQGVAVSEPSSEGVFTFRSLWPGSWRLLLRDAKYGWGWFDPDLVVVRSGQVVNHSMAVELYRGRLEVVALDDGTPLGNAKLLWTHQKDAQVAGGWLATDHQGLIDAQFPAGEYRFYSQADDEAPGATVIWTSSGPDPRKILLPRGGF